MKKIKCCPIVIVMLTGCGQPGPLYLPTDKPPVYVKPDKPEAENSTEEAAPEKGTGTPETDQQ